MSTKATDLIRAAPKFLGVPYSTMDCQAFVEAALKEIGINENLPGSNAWYRHMTWVGTPEECKASFGKIPPGAFLFILERDGKEPEKYKPDGIGNASHIGIYTGMTGREMLKDCPAYMEMEHTSQRNAFEKKVQFGNGAIHSSQSRGCVCTSNFSGKSIEGGWNRVGLWDKLSYDIDIPGEPTEEVKPMTATVNGPNGETVFLRTKPSSQASWICRVPTGAEVETGENKNGWTAVSYNGQKGYMMSKFLAPAGSDPEQEATVPVQRSWLMGLRQQATDIGKQIDEILGVK